MCSLIKQDRFSDTLCSVCCDITSCVASGSLCCPPMRRSTSGTGSESLGRQFCHHGAPERSQDPGVPSPYSESSVFGLHYLCSCWVALCYFGSACMEGRLKEKRREPCSAADCWHCSEQSVWYEGDGDIAFSRAAGGDSSFRFQCQEELCHFWATGRFLKSYNSRFSKVVLFSSLLWQLGSSEPNFQLNFSSHIWYVCLYFIPGWLVFPFSLLSVFSSISCPLFTYFVNYILFGVSIHFVIFLFLTRLSINSYK